MTTDNSDRQTDQLHELGKRFKRYTPETAVYRGEEALVKFDELIEDVELAEEAARVVQATRELIAHWTVAAQPGQRYTKITQVSEDVARRTARVPGPTVAISGPLTGHVNLSNIQGIGWRLDFPTRYNPVVGHGVTTTYKLEDLLLDVENDTVEHIAIGDEELSVYLEEALRPLTKEDASEPEVTHGVSIFNSLAKFAVPTSVVRLDPEPTAAALRNLTGVILMPETNERVFASHVERAMYYLLDTSYEQSDTDPTPIARGLREALLDQAATLLSTGHGPHATDNVLDLVQRTLTVWHVPDSISQKDPGLLRNFDYKQFARLADLYRRQAEVLANDTTVVEADREPLPAVPDELPKYRDLEILQSSSAPAPRIRRDLAYLDYLRVHQPLTPVPVLDDITTTLTRRQFIDFALVGSEPIERRRVLTNMQYLFGAHTVQERTQFAKDTLEWLSYSVPKDMRMPRNDHYVSLVRQIAILYPEAVEHPQAHDLSVSTRTALLMSQLYAMHAKRIEDKFDARKRANALKDAMTHGGDSGGGGRLNINSSFL